MLGFPGGSVVKNPPAKQETQFQSLDQKDPLEKEMAPTPVFLPGKFHGQRSLASYSPWGHSVSDTPEQLSMRAHMLGLKLSQNPQSSN